MLDGEDQKLLGVLAALGTSRLDVVERVGASLGRPDIAGAVAALDGVRLTDDRILIDARWTTDPVDRDALQQACRVAADALAADDDLEEVGRLAMVASLPDVMQAAVRAALRTEPPKVSAGVLRTWSEARVLPDEDPHHLWIEAACAASSGQPHGEVLARYESARAMFEAEGDVEAEISVGLAAAVLARRHDDLGTLIRLVARATTLAAAGHDDAVPPAVLGEALGHQLGGRPAEAVAALDRFPADRIGGEWAAQVLMVRGTNLMLLDRTDEAVAAFDAATGHGGPWTYAVALELLATARWNDGDHVGAIADVTRSAQVAREAGAVQAAALANSHAAVLLAADGRLDEGAPHRASPGPATDDEVHRLLAVASVLRSIADGSEDLARAAAAALDQPTRAVRSAHWTVALQAALVPEAASALDAVAEQHPSLAQALEVGRLGAAFLASGAPAPASARRLLPRAWCEIEAPTVEVQLLGTPTVLLDGRPVVHADWERQRVRDLCLHLALIPGSSREQVAEQLWPDLARDAAQRNLRVTLTYLLNVVDPGRTKGAISDLLDTAAGALAFTPTPRLRIDVREAASLADQIRTAAVAGDVHAVVRATRRLARIPDEPIAGGAARSEWIDRAEEVRGEHLLQACLAAGPILLRNGHPDLAEALARRGLVEDPWAERLHQVVVRSHLARDDLDAARRALRRALRALDELKVRPEVPTVELARLVGVEVDAAAAP